MSVRAHFVNNAFEKIFSMGTIRSEGLPRVEIVNLTRAQRDLLVSLPIHYLQLERLDLFLQSPRQVFQAACRA